MLYENDGFGVVQAYWDDGQIAYFREHYKKITAAFLPDTNDNKMGSKMYYAVNDTMKDKKDHLPDGHSFFDKDGIECTDCRVKWWQPNINRTTLKYMMLACPKVLENKDVLIGWTYHAYTSTKPVFFGRYCLQGEPHIENIDAIGLEYSVAKGGILVAYRLGEHNDNLHNRFFGQRNL